VRKLNQTEIRDELKDLNLSFTEIAKRVGERWQQLNPEGKEPFESQAALNLRLLASLIHSFFDLMAS
jgi:hypothetical protein